MIPVRVTGFLGGAVVMNPPANAEDARDMGSIPGLGKSPGVGNSTEKAMAPHSSTLAWKILWMEEPSRLQSMGSLRVGHN